MIIQDGTGHGYESKVDEHNMLHTRSVRTHEALYAALAGDGYNLPWGGFTLTTATASAMTYFFWDDSEKIAVLSRQIFSLGPSTGGSGLARLRVIRNPTGGTLLSGGTEQLAVNTNFGSGAVPSGTFKKGAQGSTVTGGTTVIDVGLPTGGMIQVADINWIISNGLSYAVEVTPPAGNTSMAVYLMDKFYRAKPDVVI